MLVVFPPLKTQMWRDMFKGETITLFNPVGPKCDHVYPCFKKAATRF